MRATDLWRSVLATQLALAAGIAGILARRVETQVAGGVAEFVALTALGFLALQYVMGALVLAASRALAPAGDARRPWPGALRAALTEPLHFLRAQWSMARGPLRASALAARADGHEPLLLVHGFACNSGVWRALLPRLRAAGFDPIHAVDLAPVTADIDAFASVLARELAGLQGARGDARVTLLAHSMGGLVCRAMLGRVDARGVRRLVTIATPHAGAAIARLLRTPAIVQMRPGSPWLSALRASTPAVWPVPVVSVSSRDDNFVTPAASARLPGARCMELAGLGHFGLLASRRAMACVADALREPP